MVVEGNNTNGKSKNNSKNKKIKTPLKERFLRWALNKESWKEHYVRNGLTAFLASFAAIYGITHGPGILLYELKNHVTTSEGSILGTIQKVSKKGTKALGVYEPFDNYYEGYLLKEGTIGMTQDNTFYYNLDSRGIDFTIDKEGWPKDLRKVDSRDKLAKIIDLCEGTRGSLKYIVPMKKVKKLTLPFEEEYQRGRKTGEIRIMKVYEKEIRERYFEAGVEKTRPVKKKFKDLEIDEWVFWKWRGSISKDIGDKKTYNTEPHFVRAIEISDECLAKVREKYGTKTSQKTNYQSQGSTQETPYSKKE